MAELGVTRSDNDGGLHSNSGWIWACPIPAANVPGGTLTQIEVWINDGGSSDGYRLMIFQGGVSVTDPTGNSLIWNSDVLSADGASFEFIATAIADVAFAANSILWVCIANEGSCQVGRAPTDGSEDNDFHTSTWRCDSYAHTSTPPSSLGGIAGTAYADPLKFILTYTESAGGASVGLLQQMHYYYS